MPTVYVDFVAGSSGDGSTGTPYSNIDYALTQETATTGDLIIKCRGTTNASWTHGATINITGHAFDSLVIEPDTAYVWQDTQADPPLTIWTDGSGLEVFEYNQANVTVRGFRLENRRSGSGQTEAVQFGSGSGSTGFLENCKVFSNSNAVQAATGGSLYGTVVNCLLSNYDDDDTSDAAFSNDFSNLRLYYCVIAAGGGQAVGLGTGGTETNSEVINCLFLDYSDAIETGVTLGAVSSNATSGTDPGDIGTSPVTGVVAGDFVSAAIVNPRTGGNDFRLAASSALAAQGENISGVTTDAFGNTRDASTPCIGYHELAAAGADVTGTGTPAAQAAIAVGSGAVGRSGSGTPAAGAAAASGVGSRIITGTGVAAAQVSSASGAGTIFSTVSIELTAANNRELKDAGGVLVSSLVGVVWEWYDDPDSTAGNPTDSGTFNTNVSGEATFNVNDSALANGQFGQLIVYHPSDPDIRATLRVPVVA